MWREGSCTRKQGNGESAVLCRVQVTREKPDKALQEELVKARLIVSNALSASVAVASETQVRGDLRKIQEDLHTSQALFLACSQNTLTIDRMHDHALLRLSASASQHQKSCAEPSVWVAGSSEAAGL